jgi:hypothetical protein
VDDLGLSSPFSCQNPTQIDVSRVTYFGYICKTWIFSSCDMYIVLKVAHVFSICFLHNLLPILHS